MKTFTQHVTEAPQSVADLEQWARTQLGIANVSYGRNKSLAADINAALGWLKSQGYRMPTRVTSQAFRNQREGAVYSVSNDALFVNVKLPNLSAAGLKPGWLSSTHKWHHVFHEFGHMLHSDAAGSMYDHIRNLWLTDDAKETIEAEVSRYALVNGLEFVAEVVAGRLAGKHYTDTIMRIYQTAHGPHLR